MKFSGKETGEPDQILAAWKSAKVAGDVFESGADGVVDAELRLEGGVLGFKLLHTGDGGGAGLRRRPSRRTWSRGRC